MSAPSSNLLGRRILLGRAVVVYVGESAEGFQRKKLKTLSREISFQFAWLWSPRRLPQSSRNEEEQNKREGSRSFGR